MTSDWVPSICFSPQRAISCIFSKATMQNVCCFLNKCGSSRRPKYLQISPKQWILSFLRLHDSLWMTLNEFIFSPQTLVNLIPGELRKVAAEEEIGARGWDKVPTGGQLETSNRCPEQLYPVVILSEFHRISGSFLYVSWVSYVFSTAFQFAHSTLLQACIWIIWMIVQI